MADDTVDQAAVEQEAKEMGWEPKESFRGDPKNWVDAQTFVDKGRHILPIVQENNKRLQGQVTQLGGRLASAEEALRAATATINALEESHNEDVKEQVAAARKDLKVELAAASRDGDHEAVADLTVKLTELGDAEEAAKEKKEEEAKKVAAAAAANRGQIAPEVHAWMMKNPDFMKNPRKVALARVVGEELRANGETMTGGAFMDLVAAEVDKTLGIKRGTSKVASGNGGSDRSNERGGGASKTYEDLPPEAKAACDKMEKRLVGANRAHKDQASWRKSYTSQYFEGE